MYTICGITFLALNTIKPARQGRYSDTKRERFGAGLGITLSSSAFSVVEAERANSAFLYCETLAGRIN